VLGVTQVYGGDNRIYNNLFPGTYRSTSAHVKPMCTVYNDCWEPSEFYKKMEVYDFHMNDRQQLPIWVDENAYAGYAAPFRAEEHPIFADGMQIRLAEEKEAWVLTVTVPETVINATCRAVTTERLGTPIYTEEPYENPDGTPVDFTRDFFGEAREGSVPPGPFAKLSKGEQRLIVWDKM
jgi:hypothetical protein